MHGDAIVAQAELGLARERRELKVESGTSACRDGWTDESNLDIHQGVGLEKALSLFITAGRESPEPRALVLGSGVIIPVFIHGYYNRSVARRSGVSARAAPWARTRL